MNPETFDLARGDRFESSCPECRGFGYRAATAAEVALEKERATKAARAAYREVRAIVCRSRRMSAREFDEMARARVSGSGAGAEEWLGAAAKIADLYGLVKRKKGGR